MIATHGQMASTQLNNIYTNEVKRDMNTRELGKRLLRIFFEVLLHESQHQLFESELLRLEETGRFVTKGFIVMRHKR